MATIRLLPPGSLSNFSRNSGGRAFALNWDNDAKIPLIVRPVEILFGSAVASSCSLSVVHEILAAFVIPVGTLGVNSALQIEPVWSFTSSANNKTVSVKVGDLPIYSATRTTSVKEAPLLTLANRNSLTSQIQPHDGNYVTAGATAPATYAIDFSKDQYVEILGQRANVADTLTLEYYRVLHFIGD